MARMATQILAAKSTQTQIRCPALHPASTIRKGGTDAHLARARCRHAHLHALLWSPFGRCGPLGRASEATARATEEDGTTFWAKVVGINAVRMSDCPLLRVLETWSGTSDMFLCQIEGDRLATILSNL